MRTDITGDTERTYTFDSVADCSTHAAENMGTFLAATRSGLRRGWHGVTNQGEAMQLANNGWDQESEQALAIAEQAIETTTKEHEVPGFKAFWDVSGCEVDVARYLASEPENMIDYEIVPTTRVGRVIILCASVAYSSAVSPHSIKQRGYAIAALALALNQLGYATELWADVSVSGHSWDDDTKRVVHYRTLVKGASDILDPAKIMFAYCHPAMLRVLGLSVMHELPQDWQKAIAVGGSYGTPTDPKHDLPEGAIYLPSVKRSTDIPEPQAELLKYLRQLGVIED